MRAVLTHRWGGDERTCVIVHYQQEAAPVHHGRPLVFYDGCYEVWGSLSLPEYDEELYICWTNVPRLSCPGHGQQGTPRAVTSPHTPTCPVAAAPEARETCLVGSSIFHTTSGKYNKLDGAKDCRHPTPQCYVCPMGWKDVPYAVCLCSFLKILKPVRHV